MGTTTITLTDQLTESELTVTTLMLPAQLRELVAIHTLLDQLKEPDTVHTLPDQPKEPDTTHTLLDQLKVPDTVHTSLVQPRALDTVHTLLVQLKLLVTAHTSVAKRLTGDTKEDTGKRGATPEVTHQKLTEAKPTEVELMEE